MIRMVINISFRKKFSLILFLLSLIRRVYVCLTSESCDSCRYLDRCNEDADELFVLVSDITSHVRRSVIMEV